MKRLILALVGVAATLTTAVVSAGPVAPDVFFKHPDYRELRLSPSGKYLAALIPSGGRIRLAVIDLDTRASSVPGALRDEDIDWFAWVNDERLVFSAIDLQSGLGEQRGGGLFAVNRDGTDFRILAPTIRSMMHNNQYVYRYTSLLATLHDGSDDILVINNEQSERSPDVYRMNTKTARKSLVSTDKPADIARWVADRKGAVRAAIEQDKGKAIGVYWRPAAEAKWVRIAESNGRDRMIAPVAFDGDGSLVVASNIDRDTWALYRYDSEKRALGELIAGSAQADLSGGLVFDTAKNQIVGLIYQADHPGSVWFDSDWARMQKGIDTALPGHMNVISTAGNRALIFSYSDIDPGSYYLYDKDKRRLEMLASRQGSIKPDQMPSRQAIRYRARDGLEIPAYLTLPKNASPKDLPLVVLVHGGPWVHGASWAFSAEAAYLASLGYAVLEPAFRGSTGWGTRLYTAGFKQWGLAMQDDLDDGMDWLVGQGIADAKRACIMGGSYGGYAVMMGLARNPERWRCGINYLGPTDINLMFDITWADFSNSDFIRYTAKELIGDPDHDAAKLRAASPLANASKIKAPVLMVYGGQDRRVPIVFGEKMRDALKANGVPVEWVVYGDEGHGFLLEKNRIDFYARVGEFLNEQFKAK
jgi:dipeptidyl aminopeptidase/acylaminoacyl peptidase